MDKVSIHYRYFKKGVEPRSYPLNDDNSISPMDYTVTILRQSRYAHLDKISVSEGDVVKLSTQVGLMGNTGVSTGPHLHLEIIDIDNLDVKYADRSGAVNPLLYYPNITFQSVGVFDEKNNFHGVEDLLLLTSSEITNLGISKKEILKLISDDYVKEMISESGINRLKNLYYSIDIK